jgi:SAM-dependent methyltransferase
MSKNANQVWNWSTIQRRHDFLMNKAYVHACGRLVKASLNYRNDGFNYLDVGAGSGLVLRHLTENVSSSFRYTGMDLSQEGLARLVQRAKSNGRELEVRVFQQDISIYHQPFDRGFDKIISNFCLYTIKDYQARFNALSNIRKYLNPNGGSFHIALPSEFYSANNISIQCLRDEIADRQNIVLKIVRAALLVPYQWKYVLRPIEDRVNSGEFLRFTEANIREEFKAAGLKIEEINLDYGFSGYHIHGRLI